MNYYDIRRLVRVYAAIEDGLFAMVSPSRVEGVTDNDGKLHQHRGLIESLDDLFYPLQIFDYPDPGILLIIKGDKLNKIDFN